MKKESIITEFENEVKIIDVDFEKLIKKLEDKNARLILKENQKNILILNSNKDIKVNGYFRLRKSYNLLRGIRKPDELTFKENLSGKELRSSKEHIFNTNDIDTCLHLLDLIGYNKHVNTLKKRISYLYRGTRFDLDTFSYNGVTIKYCEIEIGCVELSEILEEFDLNQYEISIDNTEDIINRINNEEFK